MGLDTVELVITVEEHFGITIKDAEAEAVVTVGDLTRLVYSRIAAQKQLICYSMQAFLQLRADVRSVMADESVRIRPRQKIAETIPMWKRRAFWRRLGRRMGTSPPSRSPRWLKELFLTTAIVFTLVGLAPAAIEPAFVPLSLTAAIFLWGCLAALLAYFLIEPAAELATFGDAARRIAGTQAAQVALEGDKSVSVVEEELREMIVEILGVDRSAVVPSARFVADLGAG